MRNLAIEALKYPQRGALGGALSKVMENDMFTSMPTTIFSVQRGMVEGKLDDSLEVLKISQMI